MDISEIRQKIDANREKLASFRGLFDLEGLEEEIAILENKMTEPDFGTIISRPKTSQELNELKTPTTPSTKWKSCRMKLKFYWTFSRR